MEKVALNVGRVANTARRAWKHPFTRSVGRGMGTGAVVGGVAGGAFGAAAPAKGESRLKSTARGAAWGAGIGAGVGGARAAQQYAAESFTRHSQQAKQQDPWENFRRQSEERRRKWEQDFRSRGRSYSGRSTGPGREAPSAQIPRQSVPSWLKGVKTKQEAKNAYRAQAMKHHPDRGGNAERMKEVNTAWDSFQKHHFDKLSSALFSELYAIFTGL